MASSTILQFIPKYSLYTDCITFSLGLIGNALNIFIFTRLKCFRNNRCGLYLTIESISNFLNHVVALLFTVVTSIYGLNVIINSLFWCRFRYIMSQTTTLIMLSMICIAACDQFFSTNYRFHLRQICTIKLARCLVFLSISLWFFHSLLFGFYVNVGPLIGCTITNQIWIQYSTYFFYPVLAGLFPITIAASFSLLAYRNVRRIVRRQIPIQRRRFDRQITAMVLLRAIVFVFLIFPYSSYRVYAINNNFSQTDVLRYTIERLVQAIFASFLSLNDAISFYLFVISSSRYRRQVKYVLVKRCWRRWKNMCCANENQVHPEIIISSDTNLELE